MSRKVGLYIRVSTLEQAESGISIDAQRSSLQKFCELHGWNIHREYVDAARSAATMERKALQKLLKDCRSGEIDTVVVFKLDRLSRSLRDLILLMDELKRCGVDFVSVTERIDTTTAAGKLMFHIIGAFAEFEREMTIERTKLAMDKKVKEGSFVGRLPFGYRYDDARRIVLSEDAETVRRIFLDFLETQNVSEVARRAHLSRMQVYRILRNPFYAGIVHWRDVEWRGNHPKVISKRIFEKVQRILNSRKNKATR
ncbi:MAG: Site-specific DNA recombinase SpoIVCA/DNA invertase PinE [Candidatus Alkanophagales archaeon MCA70_species_2]|nr:Site-specific DNA recombinase SpoIVCA/DNA invertase PinE [Candidatus Alkanophaga liquidiphilum]